MGRKKNWTEIQFFQIESFADNFILIYTGDECKSGFFQVNLSGRIDAVMYKSRLYTKMHLWSGFSAQAFRDWADIRPNR